MSESVLSDTSDSSWVTLNPETEALAERLSEVELKVESCEQAIEEMRESQILVEVQQVELSQNMKETPDENRKENLPTDLEDPFQDQPGHLVLVPTFSEDAKKAERAGVVFPESLRAKLEAVKDSGKKEGYLCGFEHPDDAETFFDDLEKVFQPEDSEAAKVTEVYFRLGGFLSVWAAEQCGTNTPLETWETYWDFHRALWRVYREFGPLADFMDVQFLLIPGSISFEELVECFTHCVPRLSPELASEQFLKSYFLTFLPTDVMTATVDRRFDTWVEMYEWVKREYSAEELKNMLVREEARKVFGDETATSK